jgi:hypothetical protein
VTSKKNGKGGRRWRPTAFTEHGVAMLSSVLRSSRAAAVNIQIIRTFAKLRELVFQNAELLQKIESLELRYDEQFSLIFEAIRKLIAYQAEDKKPEIGF